MGKWLDIKGPVVADTVYADNTLADDVDRVMDEVYIERAVGMDSLTRFGEYEPDSVFVRND